MKNYHSKENIMDKFWAAYLRYWKTEVRDIAEPPTEDGFWAWYAYRLLDQEHVPERDPEIQKDEDDE